MGRDAGLAGLGTPQQRQALNPCSRSAHPGTGPVQATDRAQHTAHPRPLGPCYIHSSLPTLFILLIFQ